MQRRPKFLTTYKHFPEKKEKVLEQTDGAAMRGYEQFYYYLISKKRKKENNISFIFGPNKFFKKVTFIYLFILSLVKDLPSHQSYVKLTKKFAYLPTHSRIFCINTFHIISHPKFLNHMYPWPRLASSDGKALAS